MMIIAGDSTFGASPGAFGLLFGCIAQATVTSASVAGLSVARSGLGFRQVMNSTWTAFLANPALASPTMEVAVGQPAMFSTVSFAATGSSASHALLSGESVTFSYMALLQRAS